MEYWILGFVATLISLYGVIALTATIVVFRDSSLAPTQRVGKLAIAWLLPYIGGLLVLYLINEYATEIIPGYVLKGPIHYLLFAPVKPPPHGQIPMGVDDGYIRKNDASDTGFGGEGGCGAGSD